MSKFSSDTRTPIFSLPNLLATSVSMAVSASTEASRTALLPPAYRYFFTSSTRLMFPPTSRGKSVSLPISLITDIAPSCEASSYDKSIIKSSSAPAASSFRHICTGVSFSSIRLRQALSLYAFLSFKKRTGTIFFMEKSSRFILSFAN